MERVGENLEIKELRKNLEKTKEKQKNNLEKNKGREERKRKRIFFSNFGIYERRDLRKNERKRKGGKKGRKDQMGKKEGIGGRKVRGKSRMERI